LGTYEVPAGAKGIDTKWVLREKEERSAEDPKRYKARLAARGFTQWTGIDYDIHGSMQRSKFADPDMPCLDA